MSILLEILNEHALSVDFGMFILIWMVQIIVYPTFHKIKDEQFVIGTEYATQSAFCAAGYVMSVTRGSVCLLRWVNCKLNYYQCLGLGL